MGSRQMMHDTEQAGPARLGVRLRMVLAVSAVFAVMGSFLTVMAVLGVPLRFPLWAMLVALGVVAAGLGLCMYRHGEALRALKASGSFDGRYVVCVVLVGYPILSFAAMTVCVGMGSVLSVLPLLVGYGVLTLALGLSFAGWVRRVGDEIYCAKCGYECRTDSPRCSECGHIWRGRGGVVRGVRVANWSAVVGGVLLAVGGFALGMNASFRHALFKIAPTGSLIRAATEVDWPTSETVEFVTVLTERNLTSNQEARLASGLLDQRLHFERLSWVAVRWLETRVLRGKLPDELCERYFREMADFWIYDPASAVVGRPFTLRIASQYNHAETYSILDVRVYFAGVSTDGGETFTGRSDEWFDVREFGGVQGTRGMRVSGPVQPQDGPVVKLNTPGEHEVCVRLWLAVVRGGRDPGKVTWREDGQPVFPPAVVWSRRIDLTKTIQVREAGVEAGAAP